MKRIIELKGKYNPTKKMLENLLLITKGVLEYNNRIDTLKACVNTLEFVEKVWILNKKAKNEINDLIKSVKYKLLIVSGLLNERYSFNDLFLSRAKK